MLLRRSVLLVYGTSVYERLKAESPRARLSNERITSGRSALGITLDVPIKIERREHGEY